MLDNLTPTTECRVMVMAGGTGGHVFPALAVAQKLREANASICWLGTSRGIESDLVPAQGIELHFLSIEGLRGRGILALLRAPVMLLRSVLQALTILSKFKPDVVLGMGGFASGPGALAAKLKGIPLVIHEQNSVAGTTNKISAKLATRIMAGFPNTLDRSEWCGNPVRPEIAAMAPPHERLSNREGPMKLLVLGGSRGALALNKLIPKALSIIDVDLRPEVLHQTGEKHVQATIEMYLQHGLDINGEAFQIQPFIEKMDKAYRWADFVICRAGALTIAELTAAGLGALLIPFPYAIDDHQTTNGDLLVNFGAAKMIQERELTPNILAEQITEMTQFPDRRLTMASRARELAKGGAAERVAAVCMEVAGE